MKGLKTELILENVLVPSVKLNIQGEAPVKVTLRFALEPEQIVVLPVIDAVGFAFIVAVTLVRVLVQVPLSKST